MMEKESDFEHLSDTMVPLGTSACIVFHFRLIHPFLFGWAQSLRCGSHIDTILPNTQIEAEEETEFGCEFGFNNNIQGNYYHDCKGCSISY